MARGVFIMKIGAMVFVLPSEYGKGAIKIEGRVPSWQIGIVKSAKVKTGCPDDTECEVLLGSGKRETILEGNLKSFRVLSPDQERLWDTDRAFQEFAIPALLQEVVNNLSESKKRFLFRQHANKSA